MRPLINYRQLLAFDSLWLTEFYYRIGAGNNGNDSMQML